MIIAGNHDITFDEANYSTRYQRFGHGQMYNCAELKELVSKSPGVTYLEDSGTTINGINIWGSPWYVASMDVCATDVSYFMFLSQAA